jgi:hypothetical protein
VPKYALICPKLSFKGKSTGSPEYSNYSRANHKLRFFSRIELGIVSYTIQLGIVSYTIQYWIEKATPFEPIYDLN